jgi:hypothetical protein
MAGVKVDVAGKGWPLLATALHVRISIAYPKMLLASVTPSSSLAFHHYCIVTVTREVAINAFRASDGDGDDSTRFNLFTINRKAEITSPLTQSFLRCLLTSSPFYLAIIHRPPSVVVMLCPSL